MNLALTYLMEHIIILPQSVNKKKRKPMIPDNVKPIPKSVSSNQELIQEALDLGCTKAKVILIQTISMAHWVDIYAFRRAIWQCLFCTPERKYA